MRATADELSGRDRLGTRLCRIRMIAVLSIVVVSWAATALTGWVHPSSGVPYRLEGHPPTEAGLRITFEKDLEIGADEADPDSLIYVIAGLAVDEAGRIYVLDASAHAVKVYSPEGELLRAIGRQGQGPGEFKNPVALSVHDDAGLVVAEAMPPRISFFGLDGEFRGTSDLDFGGMVTAVSWLDGENFLVQRVTPTAEGDGFALEYALTVVDRTGTSVSDVFSMRRAREAQQETIFERDSYGFDWCVDADGRVSIVDDPYAYAIKVLDTEQQVQHVVEREFEPIKRTRQRIEELNAELRVRQRQMGLQVNVEWSDVTPIILDVFVDGSKRLWVATAEGRAEGRVSLDVFDDRGAFVTNATLPTLAGGGFHFQIRGSRIYFVCAGLDPGVCVYKIHEERR